MSTNIAVELADETDLELAVTEMLRKAKIPANIRGFNYLRTAIMLSVNDAEMINAITKQLYPTVAKQYQTTPCRIERAIRHAIEVSWDRGGRDSLLKSLPYEIGGDDFKATNSEFIAAIADYLRIKLKRRKTGNAEIS